MKTHTRFLDLRSRIQVVLVGLCLALLGGCHSLTTGALGAATKPTQSADRGPNDAALRSAGTDDDDWLLPGKSYANNRYTGLREITKTNVLTLRKAWVTQLADDGEQEASPIVSGGQMYLATPHDSVLALNAANGKLIWQHPYTPPYILDFAASRGVGLGRERVFLGTQDCRVIALDANAGKQIWNVAGCPNEPYNNTHNNWFSIASYVLGDAVILATSGGDFGNVGHITAFSMSDGRKLWDWQTLVPKTWPGTSWQHGGGAVWGGIAADPESKTLYVAPGNPGPDLTDAHRRSQDLYTDSLVALDISGTQPRVRWSYRLVSDDTHDDDPAMGAVLFEGTVAGAKRELVAIGDKAANFVVLDRATGHAVYRMAVDVQVGISEHPTPAGTKGCPNHGGGIEWNGGAYDPGTNYFIIPSTVECAIWKLASADPKWIPGQSYKGGPLPKRGNATGRLTAVDIGTGRVAWVRAFPYAAEGGVLVTATGVAFTTDLGGHLYAIDAKTGRVLMQTDTGSANVAPISAYRLAGAEYVALMSGEAGNQNTPNIPKTHGSFVTAYRLGARKPVLNSAAAQSVAGAAVQNASQPASIGSAPYSSAQVSAGSSLYGKNCASCHGAQLQGVSAPALTGSGMAHAKLTLDQAYTIVSKQMPLTAPGSLKPSEYAAIMAYMLSYDCVSRSQHGNAFPMKSQPEFSKVIFGGRSCHLKAGTGGHE